MLIQISNSLSLFLSIFEHMFVRRGLLVNSPVPMWKLSLSLFLALSTSVSYSRICYPFDIRSTMSSIYRICVCVCFLQWQKNSRSVYYDHSDPKHRNVNRMQREQRKKKSKNKIEIRREDNWIQSKYVMV